MTLKKKKNIAYTIPSRKYGEGSATMCCCRKDWCSSQISGVLRTDYVEILKQHPNASANRLKFSKNGCSGLKFTITLATKWLKDNKLNVLEWPMQFSTKNLRFSLELKRCVQERRITNLTKLQQFSL